MSDQSLDRRSPIILGALFISATFLFLFAWLLSGTTACTTGWWLWDRLSCLAPNELGDTFAGAFAPVAFVWLVAAVMLQRNELSAQRQELRDSRMVATRQVEETRKNVELIAEQTAILRGDRERAQQREADEDIDEMISILVDEMRKNVHSSYIDESEAKRDAYGDIQHDAFVRVATGDDNYSELEGYVRALRALVIQASMYARQGIKFHHSGTYSYTGSIRIAQQITELAVAASPPKKALLSAKGFDELTHLMATLVGRIEEHGQDDDEIPF